MAALPAVMAVVSAASAAYGVYEQDQMVRAQKKQQEKQNEAVHKNAMESYSAMSAAERQEIQSNLEDSVEVQKEFLRRQSNISLFAHATGTGGTSINQLLQANRGEAGASLDTLLRNRDVSLDNFRQQARAIRTGAINHTDSRILKRPSMLAGGVETMTAGAKGYLTGADVRDKFN